LLAYGTLLLEGHDVRISGQDTIRGTFSHRHAILYDEVTNEPYNRLNYLVPEQKPRFRIFNSLLSEFGVLGFEYGYSQATPEALVIWEAQFGDFTNGGQTIIDQFITSSETKWQRFSGLVLLLPHGYEGQGPEHSSARLERFLQNAADFNMSVVNLTTPANFFHALRRQLAWPFRKPLVVMAPKSLLRHPKCVSPLEHLTQGKFREVILDDFGNKPKDVKRVIMCSGKIYYDLLARQEQEKRKDVVIVRLEQLYPFPGRQLDEIMKRYPNSEKIWVQDEPTNMGAWTYLLSINGCPNWKLISRKSSASPATGYYKVHEQEQADLINRAFA
jgi:2-oxoglutarate dehydrogenase E1 component